ncbi:MAG: bifunctional acetate--CoA ligase family protein/GNAT family N-acetyltransferase [Desulfovibrionales bacterium]
MSVTNLDALFKPTSIAVIGASNVPKTPGAVVMRNLLGGSFLGPVMPVTGKVEAISGVLSYKDVDTLPLTPDMAVICSQVEKAPEYISQLGRRGTRAVVLLGGGIGKLDSPLQQRTLREAIKREAKTYDMRILGSGCMGLLVPGIGLNASLAHTDALPGRISFITQSDSLLITVLDWAKANGIGFSHCISLGDQLDVTFSSALDYLGSDPSSRAILLYVESITDARRFMSAARASARNKPILVIKSRQTIVPTRVAEACELPQEETDAIYDVAFRRAGIVRVDDIDSLFDGAQTLARSKPLIGYGLAILTNGRSIGYMAADALAMGQGKLADLSEGTVNALQERLGSGWCSQNPVVLPFNASGELYGEICRILIKDKDVGSVLTIHVPFADVPGVDAANAIAQVASKTKRTILTSWLGSETALEARKVFADTGVATYETPDKAIRAFLHMANYRRNQELLMETPDSLPTDFFPDTPGARQIVGNVLKEKRSLLNEAESRDVLAAYGVPVVETRACISAREAVEIAQEIGYPVALKIRSPQILQPFEFGGLALDLSTSEQVFDAAASMVARVHVNAPDAYIEGFTVQKMGRRPGAHELFIGVFTDPDFGPIIRFGHGGMAMRVIKDTAVALPPLNMSLSRELINRTRISRLLQGAGNHNDADVEDLCLTLIQVNQLIIDIPQITGVEINPLFVDDKGVLALGARIWVAGTNKSGPDRLAIRPYPRELEECVTLKDGRRILLRPIRPEDAPAHFEFVKSLSHEDLRLRFFGSVREFEPMDMANFTQIDYDREMAFIATVTGENNRPETLGVVRASTKPDNSSAEFAIIIRSEYKGQGLGAMLFEKIIRYCKSRGTRYLEGETLPENKAMTALARKYGFSIKVDYDNEIVKMRLPLNPK